MVFRQVLCKIQLSSGEVAVSAFNQKTTKIILFVLFPSPLPYVFILVYYNFIKKQSSYPLFVFACACFSPNKGRMRAWGRGSEV